METPAGAPEPQARNADRVDAAVRAARGLLDALAGPAGGSFGDLDVVRVGTSVLVAAPEPGWLFRVEPGAHERRAASQVAVATVLAAAGVPAVRVVAGVDQPVATDAGVITIWELEELTGAPVGAGELGALARQLHDVDLAAVPGTHGDIGKLDPLGAVTSLLDGLSDPDARWLASHAGDLATAWDTVDAPGGLVHGDLHAGNVLATPHGPVLADLELSGTGPVAYDLVAPVVAIERYGADPGWLDTYEQAYGAPVPDAARSGVLRDTYELWLTAWAVANRGLDADHDLEARNRMARWRTHADPLPRWQLR
jgi:hypothetical protein